MPDVTASISIWHARAAAMRIEQNQTTPPLFRLQLCDDVSIILDREAGDAGEQAAAMRRLAELATQAAADLEGGSDG